MSAPDAWDFPFARTYALVTAGRLACPSCATIILFGPGQPHAKQYDKITGFIECQICKRSYQLGIVLWPARKGRRKGGDSAQPKDQRPTVRELAQLRDYARGFVAEADKDPTDPVNRFLAGECCCEPLPWRAECPIHGPEGYPPKRFGR